MPLLGDIPGLGWLFKEIREVKDRRELLIVLTPHVMSTIEQMDKVTADEVESLSLLRSEEGREDRATKPYIDRLRELGRGNDGPQLQQDDSLPDVQGRLMRQREPRERSAGPMLLELLPGREKALKRPHEVEIDPDSLPDIDVE